MSNVSTKEWYPGFGHSSNGKTVTTSKQTLCTIVTIPTPLQSWILGWILNCADALCWSVQHWCEANVIKRFRDVQKCKGLCFIPSGTGDSRRVWFLGRSSWPWTWCFLLACWSTSLAYCKLEQINSECKAIASLGKSAVKPGHNSLTRCRVKRFLCPEVHWLETFASFCHSIMFDRQWLPVEFCFKLHQDHQASGMKMYEAFPCISSLKFGCSHCWLNAHVEKCRLWMAACGVVGGGLIISLFYVAGKNEWARSTTLKKGRQRRPNHCGQREAIGRKTGNTRPKDTTDNPQIQTDKKYIHVYWYTYRYNNYIVINYWHRITTNKLSACNWYPLPLPSLHEGHHFRRVALLHGACPPLAEARACSISHWHSPVVQAHSAYKRVSEGDERS